MGKVKGLYQARQDVNMTDMVPLEPPPPGRGTGVIDTAQGLVCGGSRRRRGKGRGDGGGAVRDGRRFLPPVAAPGPWMPGPAEPSGPAPHRSEPAVSALLNAERSTSPACDDVLALVHLCQAGKAPRSPAGMTFDANWWRLRLDEVQNHGITGTGLLARDRVPVSVAGGGRRVDREHVSLPGPQHVDQQAAGRLVRDWDRVLLGSPYPASRSSRNL